MTLLEVQGILVENSNGVVRLLMYQQEKASLEALMILPTLFPLKWLQE
jgi:hypothetical protein